MATPNCRSFIEKFPQHELAVRRLILRNSDFCAVCENHEACVDAVRHWHAQGNSERAEEYLRLSKEIEEEILASLKLFASEACQTPPPPDRAEGRTI